MNNQSELFFQLKCFTEKPDEPFHKYTALELWNDPHVSSKMLEYHLNPSFDICSRNPQFISKSVEFIEKRFNLVKDSNVCDLGCGPGLYTQKFSKFCNIVVGVDFSTRSIEYAKKTACDNGSKNIEYLNINYLDFVNHETKFDLVTLIFCDFCALSGNQKKKLFSNIKTILKPNGHVMFDVFSIVHFDEKKEESKFEKNYMNGFWSDQEYFCFFNSFKYESSKVILDKYVIIEESVRNKEIYNWLKCYSVEEIKKEMGEYGFSITDVFSDVSGSVYNEKESKEICLIARQI